jgi:drug/metabolite transporter (DMT)-like permease
MTLSFLALSMAPLTKLAALQFTVPLFGTLLAFLILREVVCARRITALAIGILGSLVIIDSTANSMGLRSVLALKSAATSALATIIVKILSWSENSTTNVLYSTMLMTALTLIPVLFFWGETRRTTPAVGAPRLPGYGFQHLLRPGIQGKRSEGVDGHRIHPAHLVCPDRLSRLR